MKVYSNSRCFCRHWKVPWHCSCDCVAIADPSIPVLSIVWKDILILQIRKMTWRMKSAWLLAHTEMNPALLGSHEFPCLREIVSNWWTTLLPCKDPRPRETPVDQGCLLLGKRALGFVHVAVDVLSCFREGRLFQIAHLMGTVFSSLDTLAHLFIFFLSPYKTQIFSSFFFDARCLRHNN